MKKVSLSEKAYNSLKRRIVNEITYGMADDTYNRSSELFGSLNDSFGKFMMDLNSAMYRDTEDGRTRQNPYLSRIKELADGISEILNKKMGQQDRFLDAIGKVDSNKFYDSEEGKDNEIEDMELGHLQDKYS